ncbi:hypothetical protein BG005_004174 [Podila minutissima]|nr:hypothetical protein BG005_004174 [Podila minutissima]
MTPPSDLNQDVLPIQLPMQSIHMSRRRISRIMTRSETAAVGTFKHIELDVSSPTVSTFEEQPPHQLSMLARFSRMITRAGKEERLHYHPNGGPHQHHHHHRHSHSHSHNATTPLSLKKQLFAKATVVTLEKKYATVHWAAEFYCTITSPCFALPLFLYLDPSFRWSAPEIHSTHFTIALSVLTALTSTLYHATLYKIFSSLDACFATIIMVPALIGSVVHCEWTPYVIAAGMTTLFVISWQRTAMLSLMLMVMMIPATLWGFIVHEQWLGLGFGLVGLTMFAADRFKFFCGHSWWHLAGGLSLWYGIASGALAK